MKLNLDFLFKNLAGKEFERFAKDALGNPTKELNEAHQASKLLASVMYFSPEKNMKFKFWAEELYKTGVIEIDETDSEMLIAWIEVYGTNPQANANPFFANVGIKGQVIDAIKKQKEKQKK